MRKLGLFLCVTLCLWLSSCVAGPQQFRRSVDDWDNRLYVQSPWMDAFLHVIPVIPLAGAVATIGDFFITNTIAFWFEDAWDGDGTAFKHYDVEPVDGEMRSLLISDTKVLRIHRD